MSGFGAHACIWTPSWSEAAAPHVIEAAATAGLDFIEIPVAQPDSLNEVTTRQLLDRAGMWATCSLGLPVQAAFPNDPVAATAFLERVLEKADRLGCPLVTGVTYGTLGQPPSHPPTPQELERVAVGLGRVARTARLLGIGIGVEPVNRYETHLVNTTQQGLDLLAAIDQPNVFLHLDTYHMNIEEKGFREPIEIAGSRLGYIHLSESDRGVPGTGNVRWDNVFEGLRNIGYSGPMAMESFVAPNPEMQRATCIWREVAPNPDALVREGLAFLMARSRDHGMANASSNVERG